MRREEERKGLQENKEKEKAKEKKMKAATFQMPRIFMLLCDI